MLFRLGRRERGGERGPIERREWEERKVTGKKKRKGTTSIHAEVTKNKKKVRLAFDLSCAARGRKN